MIPAALTKDVVIVFLDIDGVIYSPSTSERSQQIYSKTKELFPHQSRFEPFDNEQCSIAAAYFFDQQSLKHLDLLIDHGKKIKKAILIVISSDWKQGVETEILKTKILKIHHFSKYIIGKTPDKNRNRPQEIQAWLKAHPQITQYLIFDDIDNHLSTTFGNRFIKTNPKELFSRKILDEALKILDSPSINAATSGPSIALPPSPINLKPKKEEGVIKQANSHRQSLRKRIESCVNRLFNPSKTPQKDDLWIKIKQIHLTNPDIKEPPPDIPLVSFHQRRTFFMDFKR